MKDLGLLPTFVFRKRPDKINKEDYIFKILAISTVAEKDVFLELKASGFQGNDEIFLEVLTTSIQSSTLWDCIQRYGRDGEVTIIESRIR